MSRLFYWLRRLYSLDTLDSRFTAAAHLDSRPTPKRDARADSIAHNASPSKWRSFEFYVYYFIFVTAVPMMFITAMSVSQGWGCAAGPVLVSPIADC